MKLIYKSASSILEQNKLQRDGRSLPPLEGAGSGAGGVSTPSYASVPRPSFNIRTKVMKEPDVPRDKLPSNVETPAVFKTNPQRVAAQKAKDLNDKMDQMQQQALNNKMDQMQQQGIGQTKPKVSQDHYKNLKALKDMGIKQANESRMSSAYSTIRRILGEKAPVQYSDAELKAMQDKRAADLQKDRNIESDLTKSRGSQTKYLQDKAQKGNAEMKAAEKKAAEKKKVVVKNPKPNPKPVAAANTAGQSLEQGKKPDVNKVYSVTPSKSDGKISTLTTGTLGRQANVANVTLDAAKKDAISRSPDGVPTIDVDKSTKDTASAPSAIEKPEDIKTSTPRFKDPTDPINPMPGVFHPKFHGDKRQVRAEPIGVDPVSGSPLDNKPGISSVQDKDLKKNIDPILKPQAAVTPPSSEFKFSPDQEKFLGKANRQDPYILNRMPGDKPPVDYYKDPKDQELAKKINTGNETVKKIKGAIGMKESTINKKFDITDALYQSVMEVMKKDKKEGSVPRNSEEEKLAAFHGDPKRITHGDVLKARGVTKEEAEPVEEMSSKMKMKLGLYGKKKKTNEESVEEGIMDKVLPILTGGSDKDLLKKLQKDMGVPQTGQKPTAPVPAKPVKENKDTPGNSYEHQCAIHVKSESYGEGRTITTQHADPDADGNIAWYDVMFEHGIEKQVPTSTLEILVSEMHGHSKKKKM